LVKLLRLTAPKNRRANSSNRKLHPHPPGHRLAATHNVCASGVNDFMFGSGPNERFVNDARHNGMRAVSALPAAPAAFWPTPSSSTFFRAG